ncbi:MAG: hypothetical protein AB4911_10140 [Oscillochloridaceae bacterium umkhey_bin13]
MVVSRAPFLMWYDDSPKLATTTKVADAIAAYHTRFRLPPNLVLVNEADLVRVEGLEVRAAPTIHRHTFWVGRDLPPDAPAEAPPLPAPAPPPAPRSRSRK